MTALSAITNWARLLWERGEAVNKWRAHFSALRTELEKPEIESAARIPAAEAERDRAAERYGKAPTETNRVALEKASAAVSAARAAHIQNFGDPHQGSAWRIEKLADLDLLERALREARTELDVRHQAATEAAEKLAAEAGIDVEPLLRQIRDGFNRRRDSLDHAENCLRGSQHTRNDPGNPRFPNGAFAAHGALEVALRS